MRYLFIILVLAGCAPHQWPTYGYNKIILPDTVINRHVVVTVYRSEVVINDGEVITSMYPARDSLECGCDGKNYSLNFSPGNLVITRASKTITFTND